MTALVCLLLVIVLTGSAAVAQESPDLRDYEQFALTHAGDPQRGRELFRQERVTQCLLCHRIGQEGGQAGPDLTGIGGKFDRPHLIESLLQPSRQIVEGYRTTILALHDGRTVSGIVRERSEKQLTLFDVRGQKQIVATADIEDQIESDVSLMPEGLAKQLTPAMFTDLIAYLETLRPGGKPRFGEGITGPISLPPDYQVSLVTTGLDGATALEVLPDGRILICEQPGRVRVIEDGQLLPEPFVTLPVDGSWERGVIGVTIDPDFTRQPYVYVCWVAQDPWPHHRISRFLADGNVAREGSHEVLLFGDDQSKMGGKVPNGHQGGALHFGSDGCLYIGIGEQTAGEPAQDLDTLLGKILRINRDGTIPGDNPFVGQTLNKYQAIWARGCRNPFTFAVRADDGLLLINDVGGKFEEINVGVAGANYGWPTADHGPVDEQSSFQGPLHWYPQASIAGGDFHPDTGRYYFADFVLGWIRSLDPENPADVIDFATGFRRPVDLRFAADGSLYVLLRNAWVIDKQFQQGTGSLLKLSPTSPAAASTSRSQPAPDSASAAQSADAANSSVATQKQGDLLGSDSAVRLIRDAVDESAGDLPAYRIETPNATWLLEKSGAGLSSLIDRDGHDWLNFEPTAGTGAAGEYRGFPNAVHRQDGSFFHPRNQATQPSVTKVILESNDLVTIEAESENGNWACRYDFLPDRCTFTMTRMPADKRYWVLYEGTPGGSYDDSDWWLTATVTTPQPLTTKHTGDLANPEWIAFGDQQLDRSLLLLHHKDDPHPDVFYQMDRQMTVFGFGRDGLTKYLQDVPQQFSISLVESRQHQQLTEYVQRILHSSH